jgi:WNK lysine deficient protein kinase
VKDLLQLDFFLEETGIKVDLVNTSEDGESTVIQLQLRVLDAKKRKPQHKENEAIQFDYHIGRDNPEDVSQEMVSNS